MHDADMNVNPTRDSLRRWAPRASESRDEGPAFVAAEVPSPALFAPASVLPLGQLVGAAGTAGCLLLLFDVMAVATVRRRDPSQSSTLDAAAGVQLAYVGLCLFWALTHILRAQRIGVIRLLTSTPAVLLLCYVALCAMSTLWSLDPLLTAYRSVECFSYLLVIAVVCDNLRQNCSKQDIVEWLVLWSIWYLFMDTIRLTRIVGLGPMMSIALFRRGAFALGTVFFLTLFLSKRKWCVVINAVFTFLSMANKTYFGIFFGLFPGLLVGDRRFHIAFFFAACLLALSFAFGGLSVIEHTLFYGKEGVGMEHMTGRAGLWSYCLEKGMERPLLGHGFVAGETEFIRQRGISAITAHNVFLSAFLAVGALGPIVFAMFFIRLALVSFGPGIPVHWRPAFLGTTVMILMISSAAPGLGTRVCNAWVPTVLTALGMCTIARSEFPDGGEDSEDLVCA